MKFFIKSGKAREEISIYATQIFCKSMMVEYKLCNLMLLEKTIDKVVKETAN